MAVSFELEAQVRTGAGKSDSRRERNAEIVPGILYGAGKDPVKLALKHNDLVQHLKHEAFYSHILSLKCEGTTERVVLKDLQRHPVRPMVMHVDFQRVTDTTRIRMNVPLHFINEEKSPGIKLQGGIVNHNMNSVEVVCQAKDLPEYIEVDLGDLQAGHALHLSDLKLPQGVHIAGLLQGKDHDLPVAAIMIPRGVEETEAAPAAAGTPEAGATPPAA